MAKKKKKRKLKKRRNLIVLGMILTRKSGKMKDKRDVLGDKELIDEGNQER